MNTSHKVNELGMTLKVAMKAIDRLMEEKPNGGMVVNKGHPNESKISYKNAKLCIERLQRKFALEGAFSFGICGDCTKWDVRAHNTAHWGDCGTCTRSGKDTHRYDCCSNHSKQNGGYGL